MGGVYESFLCVCAANVLVPDSFSSTFVLLRSIANVQMHLPQHPASSVSVSVKCVRLGSFVNVLCWVDASVLSDVGQGAQESSVTRRVQERWTE